MTCPNCAADIQTWPNEQSAWCSRCGLLGELTDSGHLRRIRIPILTQQSSPAERNGQREAIGSNGR